MYEGDCKCLLNYAHIVWPKRNIELHFNIRPHIENQMF